MTNTHFQARTENALMDAQLTSKMAKERLLQASRTIRGRLERLEQQLESDQTHVVNSLGELQASGPAFDILCALYAAAEENVKRFEYILEEEE